MEGCLESLQMEMDINSDPMAASEAYTAYCTPTWLTASIAFMRQSNWEIHRPFPPLPSVRDRDIYLMTEFLCHSPNPTLLNPLNSCLIFLRDITLGDILDTGGTMILPEC